MLRYLFSPELSTDTVFLPISSTSTCSCIMIPSHDILMGSFYVLHDRTVCALIANIHPYAGLHRSSSVYSTRGHVHDHSGTCSIHGYGRSTQSRSYIETTQGAERHNISARIREPRPARVRKPRTARHLCTEQAGKHAPLSPPSGCPHAHGSRPSPHRAPRVSSASISASRAALSAVAWAPPAEAAVVRAAC